MAADGTMNAVETGPTVRVSTPWAETALDSWLTNAEEEYSSAAVPKNPLPAEVAPKDETTVTSSGRGAEVLLHSCCAVEADGSRSTAMVTAWHRVMFLTIEFRQSPPSSSPVAGAIIDTSSSPAPPITHPPPSLIVVVVVGAFAVPPPLRGRREGDETAFAPRMILHTSRSVRVSSRRQPSPQIECTALAVSPR